MDIDYIGPLATTFATDDEIVDTLEERMTHDDAAIVGRLRVWQAETVRCDAGDAELMRLRTLGAAYRHGRLKSIRT